MNWRLNKTPVARDFTPLSVKLQLSSISVTFFSFQVQTPIKCLSAPSLPSSAIIFGRVGKGKGRKALSYKLIQDMLNLRLIPYLL